MKGLGAKTLKESHLTLYRRIKISRNLTRNKKKYCSSNCCVGLNETGLLGHHSHFIRFSVGILTDCDPTMWPQTTQNSTLYPVWCLLWSIVPTESDRSHSECAKVWKQHSFMIFLSIYPALFMFFFWRCSFFSSAVVGDRAAWQTESGGKLPTPASIRCITNASTMDVKFLVMFDPNCRLNFPKSGKLVALLMLPDTLHPALHPVYYYQLWFTQSCRTFRVCSFS